MYFPLRTGVLLQKVPVTNPGIMFSFAYLLSMFSFASLGTRDGRILSSGVDSLAKSGSGRKSRLTQQFCVPVWFAVSKLLPTQPRGYVRWAYPCFHSSSHLSGFTCFWPFSPFASLFLANTGLSKQHF